MPTCQIRPENYKFLQEHVYNRTGIVLDHDKHYLFESRLMPLVVKHGLASIDELCVLLWRSPDSEISRIAVESMTTNETYFFREPSQYKAIRNVLLPNLRKEGVKRLRCWSAAASTGQEIYSFAMALLEDGYTDLNPELYGTDFSERVLERARQALYQQIEVSRGLPASYLVKYFTRVGLDWQLNDSVRKMVSFESIDLRRSMRVLGPFHLVFCRNVLIYFDPETKRRILEDLHGTLLRGGWLLLGGAESMTGMSDLFQTQNAEGVNVYVAR